MGSLPTYRESTIPENAKKVFEGAIFDVYQWEQELYDGSYATFEKLARADTAIVFPILEDGRILLIHEEQPGKKTEYVPPAGRVEPNETPEEAAVRELKEETGYEVTELIPLYTHTPASKIDWFIYAFIGKGCKQVETQNPDAGERIELAPVTFDEMVQHTIKEGPFYHYGYFTKIIQNALLDEECMNELRTLFSV